MRFKAAPTAVLCEAAARCGGGCVQAWALPAWPTDFRRFRTNRQIRPGAAPVEPLNGRIGVTLYEISWVTRPYEENAVSHI